MELDLQLAINCVNSFSLSSGVGCLLANADGELLHSFGQSCASCDICKQAGQDTALCCSSRMYGINESARFGGKYIFFCAMGLSCIASPVVGANGIEAHLIAGPFLMFDLQDYALCELNEIHQIHPNQVESILNSAALLPRIKSEQATAMSDLLFMTTSFMSTASGTHRMMDLQKSDMIQRHIFDYIYELKKGNQADTPYPYHLERRFLQLLCQGEDSQPQANKILNDLLGHIMYSSGGDMHIIQNRIYELLVMISRTATEHGADQNIISCRLQECQQQLVKINSVDEICLWLTDTVRTFTDLFYSDRNARYTNIVHRIIQYLQTHYSEKITLDDIAKNVFMSPAYLSRTFKHETGSTIIAFLNRIRIEKSKELLAQKDMNLLQVAFQCGFESQSYFSHIFKESCFMTPQQYRNGCNSQN